MAYLSAINADKNQVKDFRQKFQKTKIPIKIRSLICHIILDEICLTVKPDFIIGPILLRQKGKKKDMAPFTMSFLNYESLTAPTVPTHSPCTFRQ